MARSHAYRHKAPVSCSAPVAASHRWKKKPSGILQQWETDPEHNRRLYATDRSAIYGGMHLYRKR
jgi:S-adenosylmethionine:diacylglycerol 3-amino-3-carboxypropyl transferase